MMTGAEKQRAYRERHPERAREATRRCMARHRAENPEAHKVAQKRWRKKNPEKAYLNSLYHRYKNPEAARESRRKSTAKWQAANPAKAKASLAKYVKAHPAKMCAQVAARSAALANRTPPWVDMIAIEQVYEAKDIQERALGVRLHVDHEIPLRGKRVSGLHVHTNLRIIPAVENCRKGNRFNGDHI